MEQKLFMLLLGATPAGRLTEQHDIFFGIAPDLQTLVPAINAFWPEANGKIHIDVWREVKQVDGHAVSVVARNGAEKINESKLKLFFINLGGYRKNEFDEYHERILLLAENKTAAINTAKQTYFYKHMGYKEATSHIDDKYGIDIDDIYELQDILPQEIKNAFSIHIQPEPNGVADECVPGYLKLSKLAAE
jgi:hypothetical protein